MRWRRRSVILALVLAAVLLAVMTTACPRRERLTEKAATPEIIGGSFTRLKNYPWMVNLTNKHGSVCGGVLISATQILTAKHCGPNFDRLWIHGEQGNDWTNPRDIQPDQKYSIPGADGMIITLKKATTVPYVQTVTQMPPSNTPALIVGRGRHYFNDRGANGLHVAEVVYKEPKDAINELTNDTKFVKLHRGTTATQFVENKIRKKSLFPIYGIVMGNKSVPGPQGSCRGDSGGPVLINVGGKQTLLGIITHSDDKCQAETSKGITFFLMYPIIKPRIPKVS